MALNKSIKIVFICFLAGFLIAIRAFENQLFYDPFIDYFKSEYSNLVYPNCHFGLLFLNLIFRYFLNSLFSLGIIYLVFNDSSKTKLSGILLFIFLMILLFLMFLLLTFFDESQKMALFYVRRFLIQPLFLVLFIPAFHYQKLNFKKESNF